MRRYLCNAVPLQIPQEKEITPGKVVGAKIIQTFSCFKKESDNFQ